MDDNRRRRRRRRRLIASVVFLSFALLLAWFFESQATTTVIVVRYAELDTSGSNPGLSAAGEARSRELIRVIGDVDVVAGVDAIFATQFRSTQETVDPLSRALDVPLQVVDVQNVRGLEEMILRDYKGKIVLVVTDRDALPALIRRLHGSKKVPLIADDEHDNIYVLSIPWYGKVKTLRLKYGPPYRS